MNKFVGIDDLKYQEDEISEVFFVPIKKLRNMIEKNDAELIIREEEFKIMMDYIEELA